MGADTVSPPLALPALTALLWQMLPMHTLLEITLRELNGHRFSSKRPVVRKKKGKKKKKNK